MALLARGTWQLLLCEQHVNSNSSPGRSCCGNSSVGCSSTRTSTSTVVVVVGGGGGGGGGGGRGSSVDLANLLSNPGHAFLVCKQPDANSRFRFAVI